MHQDGPLQEMAARLAWPPKVAGTCRAIPTWAADAPDAAEGPPISAAAVAAVARAAARRWRLIVGCRITGTGISPSVAGRSAEWTEPAGGMVLFPLAKTRACEQRLSDADPDGCSLAAGPVLLSWYDATSLPSL